MKDPIFMTAKKTAYYKIIILNDQISKIIEFYSFFG